MIDAVWSLIAALAAAISAAVPAAIPVTADAAQPPAIPNLNSVACASAAYCLAVGATLASAYQPLAEKWNGLRWRELPSPAPGRSGALTAVACPAPAWCVAVGGLDAASCLVVGDYIDGADRGQTLAGT